MGNLDLGNVYWTPIRNLIDPINLCNISVFIRGAVLCEKVVMERMKKMKTMEKNDENSGP